MKAHELAKKLLDGPNVEVVDEGEANFFNIEVRQIDDESHPEYTAKPKTKYVYPYDQSEYQQWWAKCPKKTVITLS